MNPQAEVNRGVHAREALENPLIAEALDAYELEITEAWKTAPLRDAEGLVRLRQMLEAHRKFKAYLTTTMESGQLAQAQIRQQNLAERAKRLNPFR